MRLLLATALLALAAGCAQADPSPDPQGGGQAKGEQSAPREEATAAGAPVETGPPNTEFRPAFAGQTRAPAIKTQAAVRVTEVARGLDRPWAIAFLPDGRMLLTEKGAGVIRVATQAGALSPPVAGTPRTDARGQGGMLDVEPARDFASSRMIYWSYAEPREGGNGLAVARGRLVETAGAPPRVEGVQVVWRMRPTLDSTMHFGGRIAWARDGTLFIFTGERSVLPGRVQARKLDSHFGKVVRINADGSVPRDNPLAGRAGAFADVWSWGHRNIQAATFDADGRLWEVEMGPRGGDELNLVRPGRDYGWPTIGYGEEYSGAPIHRTAQAEGLEQPVYYWDPVISPSGMIAYSGRLFPEWRGNLLVGGLSSTALVRLALNGERVAGEERLLTGRGERIREVAQGPDGAVWLLTDSEAGKLLRLTPG